MTVDPTNHLPEPALLELPPKPWRVEHAQDSTPFLVDANGERVSLEDVVRATTHYDRLTCSGRIIDEAAVGCFDAEWCQENPEVAAKILLNLSRNLATTLNREVFGWNC